MRSENLRSTTKLKRREKKIKTKETKSTHKKNTIQLKTKRKNYIKSRSN